MQERLQKILSARGVASRRKAEEYILAGLVKVNGKVATLGQKADPEVDRVEVDGAVMQERAEMLYYLMNKPVGVETSNVDSTARLHVDSNNQRRSDTNKRVNELAIARVTTVRELLPAHLQGKIFPVGRLDKDSGGLILFTNDGALAFRLTHPKFEHDKEYDVVVDPPMPNGSVRKIQEGLMIDGTKTKPARVERIAPNHIRITLTEGRNRQIRRMCQKVGSTVTSLTRVRIMNITDTKLKPGELRLLTKSEKDTLLQSVGL